jgi:hypothetical protein
MSDGVSCDYRSAHTSSNYCMIQVVQHCYAQCTMHRYCQRSIEINCCGVPACAISHASCCAMSLVEACLPFSCPAPAAAAAGCPRSAQMLRSSGQRPRRWAVLPAGQHSSKHGLHGCQQLSSACTPSAAGRLPAGYISWVVMAVAADAWCVANDRRRF